MSGSHGVCLLKDCDFIWELDSEVEDTILSHLLAYHKIVIASIHTVYNVNEYCKYWRNKIDSTNLRDYLHGINVHPKDETALPQSYFMLNDQGNEDHNVRHKIYMDKLDSVLRQQQEERECSNLQIRCLFCPDVLTGDRFVISAHLYQAHSFTLGHPDNLVYTVRFIEHLRSKMIRLECLYCDRTFRDYKILREHMRKKLHKKLNPSNHEFDKYYLVNYREFGKSWKHLENETGHTEIKTSTKNGSVTSLDEDWADWEDSSPEITCLICDVKYIRYSDVTYHMISQHCLDLEVLVSPLSYYKQVKLINYIRYSVENNKCPFCREHTNNVSDHMTALSDHMTIPDDIFDNELYLIPVFDNDFLICCLKDNGAGEEEDEPVIIPEQEVT